MGELDFIMAKASVASRFKGGKPVLSDRGELILRQARHPLLEEALTKEGKKIVPLDIVLTPAKRILLISGPNAGGKSVCLKTVGLLQYMFQWGLPVPASGELGTDGLPRYVRGHRRRSVAGERPEYLQLGIC